MRVNRQNNGQNCEDGAALRSRKKSTRMTLSEASRLLRKRISASRQLLASGQVWKNTLPSHDCDVVITFPPSATEETLLWLLTQLKSHVPELLVEVRHHRHTNVFGFYLTTSYENMLKGAEEVRLRKRLKYEYGGGMKEFVVEEQDCFDDVDNKDKFLSSQERQSIILNMLHSLQATEGDQLLHIKFLEGQPIIPKCLAEGIVSQVLPLHNSDDLNKLKKIWVQAFFKLQPLSTWNVRTLNRYYSLDVLTQEFQHYYLDILGLQETRWTGKDDVCDYFGVKIAIYFAWLGHYTKALTVPAFFGLFMWLYYYGRDQATEDLCFVVFALFNVLWATLYLESWKRDCAELAYHWGTLDSQNELLAEPRPLFAGPLVKSPVTGRMEPTYPSWKRNLFRYCVSLPVIVFCLFVVFAVMFLIFELQTWWDSKIQAQGYPFWMTLMPKILLALVINVFDGVYHRIAVWLNDKENYRGEEEYENHLIVKELLFQFVNSFLSLFYIAFYLQDMEKLKEQLAALLITRQVVGNIKESLVPFLTESLKLAHLGADHNISSSASEGDAASDTDKESDQNPSPASSPTHRKESKKSQQNNLTQAEVESAMYKYEGTFEDYLEMFIQFGYVILFSSAFPMAAICALLNNVIEIRSDAFKLCMIFQRPFGQRVENIGTWQDAMEVMGVIAVIVNCALIGMSGQVQRMFPNLSASGTIVLIVVLEHVILSMKFGIAYAIPDVPQWVATKMAKVEFQRREAAKHLHRNALSKKKRKLEIKDANFSTPSISDKAINTDINFESVTFTKRNSCCQTSPKMEAESNGIISMSSDKKRNVTFHAHTASSGLCSNLSLTDNDLKLVQEEMDCTSGSGLITSNICEAKNSKEEASTSETNARHCQPDNDLPKNEAFPLLYNKDQSGKPLPGTKPDLDAVSISFETPYLPNDKDKTVHRKRSLPQLKFLRKNSSQESDSPPASAPPASEGKKFFSVSSSSSSTFRFFPALSLKRKKHPLQRTFSLQSPSTDSDKNKHQVSNTEVLSPSKKQQTV